MTRSLLRRPPKRPPKPSSTDAIALSHRRLYGRWGRVALWACIVLIAVFATFRGLADAFSSNPVVRPSASATLGFPDAEAQSFAARFTHAFLTFSPARPEAHLRGLEGLFSDSLRLDAVVQLPRSGRGQRVVQATVAGTTRLTPRRGTVTVAAIVQRGAALTTRYLVVPVTRDAQGGLVVDDFPSFVSPPAAAGRVARRDEQPLPQADGAAIEALLTRFLREYLRGGPVAPEFLAPGARVVRLGHDYALEDVVSVAQEDASVGPVRRVLAIVRARDRDTQAAYTLRYRFTVVKRDRWLINQIER